jgi:20S proteasome subunit alpha 4
LIAGFNTEDSSPKLYLSEPSGALSAWKSTAIGKNSDKVNEILEASYNDNMDYNKGLSLVVDCMLQYVEAGAKNMEIAVMFPGQEMQLVKDEEIERHINEIEEKKKKEESKK